MLLQGLTLPALIAKIKFPEYFNNPPEEETENYLQRELSRYALQYLHDRYDYQRKNSPLLQQLSTKWEGKSNSNDAEVAIAADVKTIYLDLLDAQRQWLIKKNDADDQLDEDIIRKHLRLIDIEEEKI